MKPAQSNSEPMENRVKQLIAKHAMRSPDALQLQTRIGEDLRLVGDDAEELLDEFTKAFQVNMSGFTFADYFPDEATSNMHYYLASIAQPKVRWLGAIRSIEAKLWQLFADKKTYKTVTVGALVEAAGRGRW